MADEHMSSTVFSRGGWYSAEWVMVKSPRWDYVGEWVQQDDHIHNRVTPDANPDRTIGRPHAYMSMVRSEPYAVGKGLDITVRMDFGYDQGPQIVLAPELGQDGNGYPEYREHYEIVLFARGINIWRHTYHEGVPQWALVSYARFPLERHTPYNLNVRVEPVRAQQGFEGVETLGRMIVVSVDGENTFAYHEPNLPDRLYVGITGYASLNRFYFFRVARP